MYGIIGMLVIALLAKWSYRMMYISKNDFWGSMEIQEFQGYDSSVFDVTREVRIWRRTFKWRVLLEIEPLIYDPKPTPFQKTFYLKVVEQFDALFIQSMPTIHESYGEIKQSVVKYKENVQPLLMIVPLNEETEWRIYCATPDNLAFTLYFKGLTFERMTKFDVEAMSQPKEKSKE